MKVTLQQVADYAKVSRRTVDRVVNNRGNVRPEVEQRVREALKELNYQPNKLASALAYSKNEKKVCIIYQKDGFSDFEAGADAERGMRDAIEELKDFGISVEVVCKNMREASEYAEEMEKMVKICGTDFGTQRGPFVNPDVFKEFYLPYYKKMNGWIHQHTEWKTLKHCCGGIFPILPLLIEGEFDAVNPVQCSAAGMDPQTLKDTYGKDILFWGGGVDTQKVLPFGTPEEVKDQVKERCEIFSKDGGYIFNTIHIIQANTPVKNIAAMIEAVKEFNGDK
mgnify:CR=1 FL=1